MIFYVITVAVIIALGGVCLAFFSGEDAEVIMFLNEYGWEIEIPYTERCEVVIPEIFDEVYNNYNIIQQHAGLNLINYRGKKALRYTYIVKNFPVKTEETVYANVLSIDGIPIGGDIMTVKLDGFMYSLNYLKTGQ